MNSQRDAFVEHYVSMRELNASEAARRAGVPHSDAKEQAKDWLKLPGVQKAIAGYRAERQKRVHADAAANVLELMCVVHSDIREVLECVEIRDGMPALKVDTPEHVTRAIRGITVKSKPSGEFELCEPCRLNGKLRNCTNCKPIPEVECKIEMYDKNAAIKLLMGHLGILVPKDGEGHKTMQTLADFLGALTKRKEA